VDDGRRVRHDLDLAVVARTERGSPVSSAGRVVAWEDGRWLLGVLVAGRRVELRGERFGESRAAALLLLRASGWAP